MIKAYLLIALVVSATCQGFDLSSIFGQTGTSSDFLSALFGPTNSNPLQTLPATVNPINSIGFQIPRVILPPPVPVDPTPISILPIVEPQPIPIVIVEPQPNSAFIDGTYIFSVAQANVQPTTATISDNGQTLSYSGGCNGQTQTINVNGNQVTFVPGISTLRGCFPDPDVPFQNALNSAVSFAAEGSIIVLQDSNENIVAILQRLPDISLNETENPFFRGGFIVSDQYSAILPDGRIADVDFFVENGGGRWNIVGCTGFRGNYFTDTRNRISMGTFVNTFGACSDVTDFLNGFRAAGFYRYNASSGRLEFLDRTQSRVVISISFQIRGNLRSSLLI